MPFTFLYRWKWAHFGENASILSGEMSDQSGFLLIPIKTLKKTYKSKRNYNNKFSLLWGEAQLCLPYDCL